MKPIKAWAVVDAQGRLGVSPLGNSTVYPTRIEAENRYQAILDRYIVRVEIREVVPKRASETLTSDAAALTAASEEAAVKRERPPKTRRTR